MDALKKKSGYAGAAGPVVLVIMDGVGIGKNPESDCSSGKNTQSGLVKRACSLHRN